MTILDVKKSAVNWLRENADSYERKMYYHFIDSSSNINELPTSDISEIDYLAVVELLKNRMTNTLRQDIINVIDNNHYQNLYIKYLLGKKIDQGQVNLGGYTLNEFSKDTDPLEVKVFKVLLQFANDSISWKHFIDGLLINLVQLYNIPLAVTVALAIFQKTKSKDNFLIDKQFQEFLILNQDDDGSIGVLNPRNKNKLSAKETQEWKFRNTLYGLIYLDQVIERSANNEITV